jgi:hypothetical protein
MIAQATNPGALPGIVGPSRTQSQVDDVLSTKS